ASESSSADVWLPSSACGKIFAISNRYFIGPSCPFFASPITAAVTFVASSFTSFEHSCLTSLESRSFFPRLLFRTFFAFAAFLVSLPDAFLLFFFPFFLIIANTRYEFVNCSQKSKGALFGAPSGGDLSFLTLYIQNSKFTNPDRKKFRNYFSLVRNHLRKFRPFYPLDKNFLCSCPAVPADQPPAECRSTSPA